MATKLLQTFDGAKGTKPDPAIWKLADNAFLDGGELQAYHPSQVELDGQGGCVFTAIDKGAANPYPQARYLSGRMASRKLFDFLYGKVTVRGWYPPGPMIYSSLCWLGAYDWEYGPFPACGEQDVNEAYPDGAGNAIIRTTMIGPGGTISHKLHPQVDSTKLHTMEWHWGKDKLEAVLNGNLVHTLTINEAGDRWAFSHPFFLVVNHGIKNQQAGQLFPARMVLQHLQVDEIAESVPMPSPLPQPGGTDMNGSEFSSKDNRFTVDGTSIYARSTATSQPAWAEYRLDFGMGANSLQVEVDNEGSLPVPAGYSYQIAVSAGNQQVGNILVKPAEVGKLNLGMLTGILVVRLAWLNDAWQPGVHDANLRIKKVGLVSNQTEPAPVSGKELATSLLKGLGWPIEAIHAVVNP